MVYYSKHSQNRTAHASFSYHELKALDYGSKKARVGSEAFKAFNACSLCLQTARDPKVCEDGHLFCNECIVSSLLSQKRDIKRQQALIERMRNEEAAERVLALEQARERVLADFEKAQSVISSSNPKKSNTSFSSVPEKVAGTKRKLEIDDEEMNKRMKESEDAALRQIQEEQTAARRAKLPNFWLPSLTPSAEPTKPSEIKLSTLCKVGKPAHPVSLKSLIETKFATTSSADPSSTPNYNCWSCRKTLTNNAKIFVLNPCGHAICQTCVDTLAKPSGQCPGCDTKVKTYIELKREGTGYASGGQVEIKRFGTAFQ